MEYHTINEIHDNLKDDAGYVFAITYLDKVAMKLTLKTNGYDFEEFKIIDQIKYGLKYGLK